MFPVQIGIVLALLLSTASCSAIQEKLGIPSPPEDFSFNLDFLTKETATDKAKEFQSKYNSAIDDMLAMADNPDYAKAEEKRQKLVAEANSLASQFQDLSDNMQTKLGKLTQGVTTDSTAGVEVGGMDVLNKNVFQEKANEFQSRYASAIDDMLSLANDPDYAKAEEKRQKMVSEANMLATKFQELANSLQNKLDKNARDKNTALPVAGFDILSKNSFQEKAGEFQSRYTGIVDDMLSFANEPDYAKAEEKRQKLVSEANALASQFQDLATKLQGNLNT
ncbi:MAG: hypothetical protein HW384_1574, partial [Dehalococcoidia bacterium]|nr:hypothetical protein [Dehalococcoidia bacterium]